MKAYIKAISYYLPEIIQTNEDLVKEFPEWSAEKVAKKLGISQRHLSSETETSGDLAYKAAKKLISDNNIDPVSIDFIMLCTQSPDYFLPTTACILQNKLGVSKDSGALDFNLGCSGYIYGLSLAKGLIASGTAKNILLITAETYSKFIHPKDKINRTIFGDAASATLISTEGFAEILNFKLGTDGSGAEQLIVKSGGMRNPNRTNNIVYDEANNPFSDDYLFMNGSEIFNFTLDVVPEMISKVLVSNNLKSTDIDHYVFHQANMYMLNLLRKKLEIDAEKFIIYMDKVGNTVSSTIPIALAESIENLNGNVLLAGFGVGLSWGSVVISINKTRI